MSDPAKPPKPPTDAGINAPHNSGIIAPNNSGTITQNQGPPRAPLGLYQSGQSIGSVEGFYMSVDGKQITFVNIRLSEGAIDLNGNVEFQNFVLSCPALMSAVDPRAARAAMIAISLDRASCEIIGNR